MIVDGSGASASDVAALRNHYGQPPGQKPGCGFPVMRLLGVIHAGTGLLLEWLDAPLFASEQTMTVDAASRLRKGDVLVGDRAFGAVDCGGFAAMDNHLQQLLRLDSPRARGWSDEEVARRWLPLHPLRDAVVEALPVTVERVRRFASDAA